MNKLFGGLVGSAACTVQLELRPSGGGPGPQPTVSVKNKRDELETMPLFANKDTISGEVKVTPIPGKRADHQGIRVQLLGEVELASERGHPHQFLSLVRDLAPPGDLSTQVSLPFEFGSVEMQYESYRGSQAQVRYLLRVTVTRGLGQSVVKDTPFWVRNCQQPPAAGPPIKMEVGIEDCLHIEFEYDRGAYHLQDTVLGRIHFLLVRIKLKHMELEIRRRETSGAGAAAKSESETVAKYEIMDGAPVRGENIPIRLSLRPYDLSPSYANVFNKFSVRYFLNLVLVDEEDRRYFKQQEITLYRLSEEEGQQQQPHLPQHPPSALRLPRRMTSLPPSPHGFVPLMDPAAIAAAAGRRPPSSGALHAGVAAAVNNGGLMTVGPEAVLEAIARQRAASRAAAQGHLAPAGGESTEPATAAEGAAAAPAAAALPLAAPGSEQQPEGQQQQQQQAEEQQQQASEEVKQPGEVAAVSSPLGDGESA